MFPIKFLKKQGRISKHKVFFKDLLKTVPVDVFMLGNDINDKSKDETPPEKENKNLPAGHSHISIPCSSLQLIKVI